MWGTKNDRAFFNTAFVNITYLYHISSYDSCTFWMRYCTKLISRGIDWIVKHISYYKTKRRCAIIIFFILIRYILLIDRFLIEMVYTLYHLLWNWANHEEIIYWISITCPYHKYFGTISTLYLLTKCSKNIR